MAESASPSRLQAHRDRLQGLRERRASFDNAPRPETRTARPAGATPGMKGAAGGGKAGGKPGGKAGGKPGHTGQMLSSLRPGMLMRIYDLLTSDVTDRSEMVPNTPFSVDGVGKLMLKLRQRAAQEDHKGAAIAAGFVNFLSAEEDDPDAISGASVEKLQELSAMASRLQGSRG